MKTMMVCAAVGALFAVSTAATCGHAAQGPALTRAEVSYCRFYAENEYTAAMNAGADFPDASYEGAAAECEVQWMALEQQSSDVFGLDRAASLALLPQLEAFQ